MFKWFIKTFRQPKAWAVYHNSVWSKVVAIGRPSALFISGGDVKGPFRSEVDCEEFCDHANKPYLYREKLNVENWQSD